MKSLFGKIARYVAVLILGLSANVAHAGIPVIDGSNLTQNIMNVLQGLQTYSQDLTAYETQLQQYQSQLSQLASLPSGAMNLSNQYTNGNIQSVTNTISSVNSLYGSLSNLQTMWNTLTTAAQQSGQSPSQYMTWLSDAASRGLQSAQLQVADARQVIQRSNDDYQLVQQWQSQIPATEGLHQAMQLNNQMMSTIVQQNADMLRLLSEDRVEKQEAQAQKLAIQQAGISNVQDSAQTQADMSAASSYFSSNGY